MASVVYLPKSRNPNARKPFPLRTYDGPKQRLLCFPTAGERKDWAIKFQHDSRESIFVDPRLGHADFCASLAAWIDRHPGSKGTRDNYRSILTQHIRPAFAGRTLASVAGDRDAVTTFLVATMPGKVCAARVGLARAAIMGTITEAVRGGKLPPTHRLADIEIAPAGSPHRAFIPATHAQLVTIAGSLRRTDLALAVWAMRALGLRAKEALALNLRNFRDDRRTYRVREQTRQDGSGLGPLKGKRAGEYRDCPVPGWFAAMLCDHLAEFGEPDDGQLFRGHGRQPYVGYATFYRSFKRGAKLAGLPGEYAPHQLRHAFASDAAEHGVAVHELSRWLGHESVDVTYRTYMHLYPDAFERGRAALDSAFAAWSQAS